MLRTRVYPRNRFRIILCAIILANALATVQKYAYLSTKVLLKYWFSRRMRISTLSAVHSINQESITKFKVIVDFC